MKKVFFLTNLMLSFLFVSAFISCNKENDENFQKEIEVSMTNLSAEWIVFGGDDSRYKSFAFSDDNSFLVLEYGYYTSRDVLHTGTYQLEGNRIVLSGFGAIEVISLTKSDFSFSFVNDETKRKYNLYTIRSDMALSRRTDMLCKTWIFEKLTYDFNFLSQSDRNYLQEKYGNNWRNLAEQGETEEFKGSTYAFTKSGNFTSRYSNGKEIMSAKWKWEDTADLTEIEISLDNWASDWNVFSVSIGKMTDKELVLTGTGDTMYFIAK